MATNLAGYVGRQANLGGLYDSILNGLYRQQDQAAKKQAAENERGQQIIKGLEGQLSKVNPAGLRQSDLQDFNKLYGEVKDAYYEALTAGDNTGRLQASGKQQEAMNRLNLFIGQSKARGEQVAKLLGNVADKPEDYADDVASYIGELNNTPTAQLTDDNFSPERIGRRINTSGVPKRIEGILDGLYKREGKLSDVRTNRVNVGGRGADVVEFEESISKEAFIRSLEMETADPAFRAWVQQQAPGVPMEEAIVAIADSAEAAGQFSRADGRQVVRDQAPRQAGGREGATAGIGDLTYNIPVTLAGERVFATKGVEMTSSNVVVPNREAVDAETGQIVNLGDIKADTGVRQGQITGILEIPALGNAFGTGSNEVVEYQIQIPNDQYMTRNGMEIGGPKNFTKTYYIRRDLLPSGTSGMDKIKQAAAKFDAARGTSQSQQNSVPSQQQFRGVPQGGF